MSDQISVESVPQKLSNFEMSKEIGKLSGALAKAQGEMEMASKDSANPFFKSKYADLSSVWLACREALSKNGLSVIQIPTANGTSVRLTTVLSHTSGEFVSGSLTLPVKECTAQGMGSAITYARRYSLAAMVGVAPDDDDDGNAASGRTHFQPNSTASTQMTNRSATTVQRSPVGAQNGQK